MLLFTGVTNNLHAQENGAYDINVTAMSESSGIHAAIGEANLASVRSLKVTGSINSYDFMIIRNKMPNLNVLDLSDASIVSNDYEFMNNIHTDNNIISSSTFSGLTNLTEVKLPRNITFIGSSAFQGCSSLITLRSPLSTQLTTIILI